MSQQVTQSSSNSVKTQTKVNKVFTPKNNQQIYVSSSKEFIGGGAFKIEANNNGNSSLIESRIVQSSYVESGNAPIISNTNKEIVGPAQNIVISKNEKKEIVKRKGAPTHIAAEKRVVSGENRVFTGEVMQGATYPLTYYTEYPNASLHQSMVRAKTTLPLSQNLRASQYVVPSNQNVIKYKIFFNLMV